LKTQIEAKIGRSLPSAYLEFLEENPRGEEVAFNEFIEEDPNSSERYWNLYGEKGLFERWDKNSGRIILNFECLKLFISEKRKYSLAEKTNSNVGLITLSRIEKGFVFGEEGDDYLYLDSEDNDSVWIYHLEGGDVLRVADSFLDFLEKCDY